MLAIWLSADQHEHRHGRVRFVLEFTTDAQARAFRGVNHVFVACRLCTGYHRSHKPGYGVLGTSAKNGQPTAGGRHQRARVDELGDHLVGGPGKPAFDVVSRSDDRCAHAGDDQLPVCAFPVT